MVTDLDPKSKLAAGKVPMGLFPLKAIYGACRVLGYGLKKYTKNSWRRCPPDLATERYKGAALRHLSDMDTGAELDDESGLPHIDHAIDSLIMLRDILQLNGKLPVDPGEGRDPPVPVVGGKSASFASAKPNPGFYRQHKVGEPSTEMTRALSHMDKVEQEIKRPKRLVLYCPMMVVAKGSQVATSKLDWTFSPVGGWYTDLCCTCGNYRKDHTEQWV